MPGGYKINNQFLEFKQIKERSDYSEFNHYFRKVLEFSHSWLNGANSIQVNTSGSTGTPKKIQLPREIILSSVSATWKYLELDNQDKALICLNTQSIGGRMMLIRTMEIGMTAKIMEPVSDPFKDGKKHEASFYSFAPIQLNAIFRNGNQHLINSSKVLILGGSGLHGNLSTQVMSLEIPCYQTYGMTETASHIAMKRINGTNPDSCYHCLPRVDIRTGKDNALEIYAPQTGYKWLKTQDRVRIIEKGKFELLGRLDDVINTGGIKLFLNNLEADIYGLLCEYIEDPEFFVFGKTDPDLGESISVCIKGSMDQGKQVQLLEAFKTRLPKYHNPREIFMLDEFPYTESGKIDRVKAKKLLNDL